MAKRKIVLIDEEKCNGCGLCIPNCAEGALQMVGGKAKLTSDRFCDGLGACLGHCPQDAIVITERDADEFDEKAVELHLHQKKEIEKPKVAPLFTGCPSSRAMHFKPQRATSQAGLSTTGTSHLSQWPVQLKLVPVHAPYFEDADLLVAADCVPFAYANFHEDFIKGRAVVVGCPKLDDIQYYRENLTEIIKNNSIKSVTVPYMEVPCCFGLAKATEDALEASGKNLPLFRQARDGRLFVFTLSDGDLPGDLLVAPSDFAAVKRLTDVNPWLAAKALPKSELVSYRDAAGKVLYGVLRYPVNYEKGKRYPTVFEIYETFFDNGFNGRAAFLASHGYAVFHRSVHLVVGRPGESWAKGVTAAANKLIDMGIADADRLGVHGTSYGGYATVLLLTQTDRFKAAINVSGKVNMVSFYTDSPRLGVRNTHAPEKSQDRIGGTLWDYPERYLEHSAVLS